MPLRSRAAAKEHSSAFNSSILFLARIVINVHLKSCKNRYLEIANVRDNANNVIFPGISKNTRNPENSRKRRIEKSQKRMSEYGRKLHFFSHLQNDKKRR